jgi:hypothetical protein
MAKQLTFNDGLCPGGRRPKLWLVKGGGIFTFHGETIPGVVVVTNSSYHRNGKWSSTTYVLAYGDNTVAFDLLAPLHGRTWPQASLAEALAYVNSQVEIAVPGATPVTEVVFRESIKEDYPDTLRRWDESAAALADLD